MDTSDSVLHIIAEIIDIDVAKTKNPSKIKWDSLQHISIISEVEEQFNVTFEPEEISEMGNFDNLMKFLENKLKNT